MESGKLIAENNFMWLKFNTRTGCYGNFATLRQCMGYDWSRLWFSMPFKNIRSHQKCYKSAINFSIKISTPKLDCLKLTVRREKQTMNASNQRAFTIQLFNPNIKIQQREITSFSMILDREYSAL